MALLGWRVLSVLGDEPAETKDWIGKKIGRRRTISNHKPTVSEPVVFTTQRRGEFWDRIKLRVPGSYGTISLNLFQIISIVEVEWTDGCHAPLARFYLDIANMQDFIENIVGLYCSSPVFMFLLFNYCSCSNNFAKILFRSRWSQVRLFRPFQAYRLGSASIPFLLSLCQLLTGENVFCCHRNWKQFLRITFFWNMFIQNIRSIFYLFLTLTSPFSAKFLATLSKSF